MNRKQRRTAKALGHKDPSKPCPECNLKPGVDLALAKCKAHGMYSLSIADEVGGFTGSYIASGCKECMSPDMHAGPSGKWDLLGSWWLSPKECVMLGAVLSATCGATQEEAEEAFATVAQTMDHMGDPKH